MKKISEFVQSKIEEATKGKIPSFPIIANGDPKLPYITYDCEQWESVYSKSGLEGFWSEFSLSIFSSTYGEGIEIVDALIDAFDRCKMDGFVDQCRVISGNTDYSSSFVNTVNIRIGHGR